VREVPPDSPTFLILTTRQQELGFQGYLQDTRDNNVDIPKSIQNLCNLPTAYRFHLSELEGGTSWYINGTEQYTFRVMHCEDQPLDADFHVEFRNPNIHGDLEEQLGMENAPLKLITGWFGLAYFIFAVFYLVYCTRNIRNFKKVHAIGCLVLVTSAAEAFASQRRYSYESEHGVTTLGIQYTQRGLKAITIFLTICAMLLLSAGWGFMRDVMTFREGRVFTVCVAIYGSIAGLAATCIDDSLQCRAYSLTEYITRALLELVVIVAANFNVSNLRSNIADRAWSDDAVRNYAYLQQFSGLRRAFFAYILCPTGIFILNLSMLRWEYRWVQVAMEYTLYITIIVYLGTVFRPKSAEDHVRGLHRITRGAPALRRDAAAEENAAPPRPVGSFWDL